MAEDEEKTILLNEALSSEKLIKSLSSANFEAALSQLNNPPKSTSDASEGNKSDREK